MLPTPAATLALMVDAGLLVLIWLVQTIIYPGFRHLAPDQFSGIHARYLSVMGWIVGPLMLTQFGLGAAACLRQPHPSEVLIFTLVLLTWVFTAGFSVPLHRHLQAHGRDEAALRRLVLTNWPRTLLWTLIPLLRWTTV